MNIQYWNSKPVRIIVMKCALLFVVMLFVKHTAAQTGVTSDSVATEEGTVSDQPETPQPSKNLKRYELINKRITDDSIAQSNAIYELYKLITKKIADDSIAQLANKIAPKRGSKDAPNQSEKNSVDQPNAMTFDAGQVFSTFNFIGSPGNTELNYTHNITSSYSLGYQYSINNGLFCRANIGMRGAGASLVNDGVNYNWTIQYFDVSAGIGYMLNLWRIKPYFSASPYFGYMLKANQTTGTVSYDILQNKSMKTTDFGLLFSPGVKLVLSDYIALYAEYKYILGLQNLETSTVQKGYNRGYSFNLGVAITIESSKAVKLK